MKQEYIININIIREATGKIKSYGTHYNMMIPLCQLLQHLFNGSGESGNGWSELCKEYIEQAFCGIFGEGKPTAKQRDKYNKFRNGMKVLEDLGIMEKGKARAMKATQYRIKPEYMETEWQSMTAYQAMKAVNPTIGIKASNPNKPKKTNKPKIIETIEDDEFEIEDVPDDEYFETISLELYQETVKKYELDKPKQKAKPEAKPTRKPYVEDPDNDLTYVDMSFIDTCYKKSGEKSFQLIKWFDDLIRNGVMHPTLEKIMNKQEYTEIKWNKYSDFSLDKAKASMKKYYDIKANKAKGVTINA